MSTLLLSGINSHAQTPIFSLYNPYQRDHMLSFSEFEAVGPGGYRAEGYHFSLDRFEYEGGGIELNRCYSYRTGHHYINAWDCNPGDIMESVLGWSSEYPTPRHPFALVNCYRGDINDFLATTDENECYQNGYDVVAHLGYVAIDYNFRNQHVFRRNEFPIYYGRVIIHHERPIVIHHDHVIVREHVIIHNEPVIIHNDGDRRASEREEENRRHREEEDRRRRDEQNRRRDDDGHGRDRRDGRGDQRRP